MDQPCGGSVPGRDITHAAVAVSDHQSALEGRPASEFDTERAECLTWYGNNREFLANPNRLYRHVNRRFAPVPYMIDGCVARTRDQAATLERLWPNCSDRRFS